MGILNSDSLDKVSIDLPVGLSYLITSAVFTRNSPLTSEPSIDTVNGSQRLTWSMKNGIISTDSAIWSFQYNIQDALTCGMLELNARSFSEFEDSCVFDQTACNVGKLLSTDKDSLVLVKSELSLTIISATSESTGSGEVAKINYSLLNNAVVLADKLITKFYSDRDLDGVLSAQDTLVGIDTIHIGIGANQQYSDSTSLNLSAGLACQLIVSVDVSDNSCICSSVSELVIPEYPNLIEQLELCSDDTIQIGKMSTPGYSYQWLPTQGLDQSTQSQTNVTLSSLQNDTIIYELTSNRINCISYDSITVILHKLPVSGFDLSKIGMCAGDTLIIETNEMYSTNLIYDWINLGVDSVIISNLDDTLLRLGFNSPGVKNLKLLIEDSVTGCISNPTEDSVFVRLPYSVNSSSGPINCAGDSVQIVALVSSGIGPFEYDWSSGIVFNDSTISNPMLLPDTTSALYSVVVEDFFGCEEVDTILVETYLPVQHLIVGTQVLACLNSPFGINATVSGGAGSYPSTIWSGEFAANLSDTTALNTIFTSDTNGIATLYLTTTDTAGCSGLDSIQVTVFNPPVVDSVRINGISCVGLADGSLTIFITENASQTNLLWSTNDTVNSISNLTTGEVTVSISDNANCLVLDTFQVPTPDSVFITDSINEITCFGQSNGSIYVQSLNDPLNQFSYEWTLDSSIVNSSQNILNTDTGIYQLRIMDSTHCQLFEYVVSQPDEIQLVADIDSVSCFGLNTGAIYLTMIGGQEPYTYDWSTNDSLSYIIELLSGDYNVTVTDSNNCSISELLTVTNSCLDSIEAPDVITPNGDGVNDNWIVLGIFNFPNSHVYVYDRWGNAVFDEVGYQNTWEGTSKSGKQLPIGTYYFNIELNDGTGRVHKGYVLIER